MATLVARRGMLQASTLTSGLALVGLWPQLAAAQPATDRPPEVEGGIAGHIRFSFSKGATVRLTELDREGRPLRELGVQEVPVGDLYPRGIPTAGAAPLQVAGKRAQAMAVRIAATGWGVPAASCRVDGQRIVHPLSGRGVSYVAWVDFV